MGVLPTPGPPRRERAGWKRRFSAALRDVDEGVMYLRDWIGASRGTSDSGVMFFRVPVGPLRRRGAGDDGRLVNGETCGEG